MRSKQEMSTKSYHRDNTKRSVLIKKISIRSDLKSRLTRKSSNVFTENAVSKPLKKKTFVTRTGSFNDNGSVSSTLKKNSDSIEKLEEETAKIFRYLRYARDAVDKGILELFHGSITIVLDQVAELKSVFQKCFPNQESTQLRTEFVALHRNLAKLMGLSDPLLLSNKGTFVDKQEATDLISSIRISIEELVHWIEENAESIKSQKSLSENIANVSNVDVKFEPDLSMTFGAAALLTRSKNAVSKSAENLLNVCLTHEPSMDEMDGCLFVDVPVGDIPPPNMSKVFSLRHVVEDIPMPLPDKKRNSAGIYEVNATSNRLPVSFSRNLTVPSRHSPTNSMGSSFGASSEEILFDPLPKSVEIVNCNCERRDSRGSLYDNVNDDCYTSDFADLVSDNQLLPPPLPAKNHSTSCPGDGICLDSRSNDVFAHTSSSNVVSATEFETDGGSEQFSPTLTLQMGELISGFLSNQTVGTYLSRKSEVHEMTYSADMLQSHIVGSSEVGNIKVLNTKGSRVPPPVPPKKHVQTYLNALGEWPLSSSSASSFVRQSMHAMTPCGICPQTGETRGTRYPQDLPPRVTSLQCSFSSIYVSCDGITALSKSSSEDGGLNPPLPAMQRDQLSSQTTLDSGYCSTAAIGSPTVTIPESSSVENKVLSPDCDGELSHPHDVFYPIPDVNSLVTESAVTSDKGIRLEAIALEEEEVTSRLVFKQPNEDGPDVRGGSIDALIVHATTPGQNDFKFQEAFLMTYRTFISPCDLIKKLLQRQNHFNRTDDVKKKKLAKNAFSFLIRVVDDLCLETDKEMLQILMDLVCQLVNDGELQMARTMRMLVLRESEKYRVKQAASHSTTLLPSFQLTAKIHSIVDFKAAGIAEQMTLLDAELFNKIEIPEVLRWSREQSEEHSPNLTKFTEHFNKMSYWCRTRILEQEEPKEREKHLMKFIKVMKHLRRLNNFNSYLAILSAVDSAPVRRLEWQKQNVEILKEFCELIDSSSSFRAYRQALAEATPPCIPYIGLVLQDLTFVNIGNLDYLPDRNINFSKCWQYFTILENMGQFQKCNYDFKKSEKIIAFFNNFDNYLSEESLWQLSEMIKPRRGSKTMQMV